MLAEAGFDTSTLKRKTVQIGWHVPTASSFFEAERDGGVRTAALLARQSPQCLSAIETAVERAIQKYATDEGYTIPMTAHIVTINKRA